MGATAGFCAEKAWFIPLGIHFRVGGGACRTARSVMTKFEIHSFWKRWDLLEEDSKERNNSTIKQLPAAASISRCISFFVLTCQWTPKNDWKHFIPSSFFPQCSQVSFVFIKTEHFQSFKKRPWMSIFDYCKPNLYFTSCYWCFNLCTPIFYQRVQSVFASHVFINIQISTC